MSILMVPQKMGNENIWFLKDLFDPQSWTKTVETKKKNSDDHELSVLSNKIEGGGSISAIVGVFVQGN